MSAVDPVVRPRPRLRWYTVLLPLLVVALPVLLLRLLDTPPAIKLEANQWVKDEGQYAGAEACRECHATIVDQQLASSHANTVRSLAHEKSRAPFEGDLTVPDPYTGVQYSVRKKGSDAEIVLTSGNQTASQKLDYEFGSGIHAFGYLGKLDDLEWLDARLNYYTEVKKWDFTSSQDKPNQSLITQPLGRVQKADAATRCFACHSTVVRAHGLEKAADGSQLRVRPDKSVLNVTCEGCHGPYGKHVQARKAGQQDPPAHTWSGDEMNQVCGRCHGLTDIDAAHPVIARFQPWGLGESKCFRASAGKLTCSSCHDPHADAQRDEAFYVQKCLSCHTPKPDSHEKVVACPVNKTTGCVGCHMPRDSKSMLHTTFTDHRIRVLRSGK